MRYEVTSPDGRKFEVNAPEGASQDDVLSYAQKQFTAKPAAERPADPMEGIGTGQRVLEGVGHGMMNLARGVGQRLGMVTPEEVAAARKVDEPLLNTTAGTAGSMMGTLAGVAPTMFIPGANSVGGAAAVGGMLGALQPTTADESVLKNVGVGAALGGVGQYGLGKAAGYIGNKFDASKAKAAADAARNGVRDQTLAEVQGAGYVVPPSQAGAGVAARVLEGVSGKYKTNQAMAVKDQNLTNQLARKALGLSEDEPLTREAMRGVRERAYQAGYAPLANMGRVETDAAYQGALDNIMSKYEGAAADFPGIASPNVSRFVEGQGGAGVPPRSAWVDGNGNVLHDFAEPQAPTGMRSLLNEIKQSGGISPSQVAELNAGSLNKTNPGLLNKKTGKSDDGLLEWMQSNGWLHPEQVRMAEGMPGGASELAKDMVRSALNGERVIHPAQADAWYVYSDTMQKIADAGINKITIPGTVKEAVGGLRGVKSFEAGNAVKMTQILRDEAADAFRTGDSALGKAKRDAAKALEDQIERGLMKSGADGQAALKSFRDARQLMAKAHDVEKALVEGGGQVNAKVLGAALQRGKPLTGELRTIGLFGNNFKDVAGVPQSGFSSPITALDAFGAAGMAGMGAGPAAIALPAARLAARSLLTNPTFQRAAVHPHYGPGALPKLSAKTLKELERMGAGGLLGAYPQQ
jgi:hypothetical protein